MLQYFVLSLTFLEDDHDIRALVIEADGLLQERSRIENKTI